MNKDVKLLAEAYYKVLEDTNTNTVVGGDPAYDKRNEQKGGVLERDPKTGEYIPGQNDEESEQLRFRRQKGYKPYTGDGKKPDTYLANHLVDQIAAANFSPSLLRSVLGQVGNMLMRVDKPALEEYCRDTIAVLEEEEETSDPNWQQAAKQQLSQTGQLASPNQGFNMKPGFFGPNTYTPIPGKGKFD